MFDKEGVCGDNIAINDYVIDISMDYPLEIEQMDCTPITIDNGYRVIDVEFLAKDETGTCPSGSLSQWFTP